MACQDQILLDDWHVVADIDHLFLTGAHHTKLFEAPIDIAFKNDGSVTVPSNGRALPSQVRYGFVWTCLGAPARDVNHIPEAFTRDPSGDLAVWRLAEGASPELPPAAERLPAQEKYNYIWTSFGEPTADIFPITEFDEGDRRNIHAATFGVHVSAPRAVENFTTHAANGYYDGTMFHRVVEDFLIQGGDPDGSGYGGQSIWGPGGFEHEIVPGLNYDRAGMFGVANRGGESTNGSQFFITLDSIPWLDGLHTVMGEVVEGLEIAKEISRADTVIERELPIVPTIVESISLETRE